jgi:hypothetical protein
MAMLSKLKTKINNQVLVTLLVTTSLVATPAFANIATAIQKDIYKFSKKDVRNNGFYEKEVGIM